MWVLVEDSSHLCDFISGEQFARWIVRVGQHHKLSLVCDRIFKSLPIEIPFILLGDVHRGSLDRSTCKFNMVDVLSVVWFKHQDFIAWPDKVNDGTVERTECAVRYENLGVELVDEFI